MSDANIPADLYKAMERVLDDNSAWIARPSPEVTEAISRAAMDFMSATSKRSQMHMVMDGAIAAMTVIKEGNGTRLAEALRVRADWLDLPCDVEAPRPYIAREQFRAAADRLDERTSLIAEVERLRAICGLLGFGGDPADEKIGWRGTLDEKGYAAPPGDAVFHCEFCYQGHENCTLIPHPNDCPVPLIRTALQEPGES